MANLFQEAAFRLNYIQAFLEPLDFALIFCQTTPSMNDLKKGLWKTS